MPKHEYKTAMQGCNVQLAVHVVRFVRDTETIVQALYIVCIVNMEKIYARWAAKRSQSWFRRNAETPELTAARLSAQRDRNRRCRSAATPEQIAARGIAERNRSRLRRSAAVVPNSFEAALTGH